MGAGTAVETFVPFPQPLEQLTLVKSTLILSSVQSVQSYGKYEQYLRHLAPQHKDVVLDSVVGVWIPADAALAHYRACDELGLSPEEQLTLGRATGHGLRQHILRVAGLVSRGLGVTPWVVFEQFPRFWKRSFEGGGVAVYKHGPKEAEVVYGACMLLESPYFRSALRGVAIGLLEAATRRCLMHETGGRTKNPHEARYRISWV
jgi:hypothetical protein